MSGEKDQSLPFYKRVLSAVSVEPAMFLFALAYGLGNPTHSALVYRKICLGLYNLSICDNLYNNGTDKHYLEETQKETSKWTFYSNFCFNIPALIAIALYGSWIDNFSRKIPLLFSPIGSILNTICMLIGALYMESNVNFLLIGQFLDGFTGGFAGYLMAAFSYSSHLSSHKSRTSRISVIYACQAIAFAISTFSSGIFLDHTSYLAVFCTIIGILVLMILYIITCVKDVQVLEVQTNPEHYSVLENEKSKLKDLNFIDTMKTLFDLNHMKDAFIVTFKERVGSSRQFILTLIGSALLLMLTKDYSVNYLFFRHPPLNWSQSLYGMYLGYSHLVHFTAQLIVLPLLKFKCHLRDELILLIGLSSEAVSRLWTGFCVETWMPFLIPVIGYLATFNYTCIRASLSFLVEPNEYGKIFAVMAWLEILAALAANFLFAKLIYPMTVEIYAGIVYFVSAILMVIPMSLAIWLFIAMKRSSQKAEETISRQVNHIIDQIDITSVEMNTED